jgi:hypothetical protein
MLSYPLPHVEEEVLPTLKCPPTHLTKVCVISLLGRPIGVILFLSSSSQNKGARMRGSSQVHQSLGPFFLEGRDPPHPWAFTHNKA